MSLFFYSNPVLLRYYFPYLFQFDILYWNCMIQHRNIRTSLVELQKNPSVTNHVDYNSILCASFYGKSTVGSWL